MNTSLGARQEQEFKGAFRILVLEHYPVLAEGLRRYLEMLGHQVEIATSLDGAWLALGARSFDVLLSDVYLPTGSCLQLLQGRHLQLPRFVATMSGFDIDEATLRQFPVRRHLVKPFDPKDLEAMLEEWADEQAHWILQDESYEG